MAGLNDRQKRFVEEYLKHPNATAAARLAGYTHPDVQGPRLLGNVGVQQSIQEKQAARSERVKLDQDWVLNRLREEATDKGEGSSHSARVRATELIGKHLAMFVDKHQHTGTDGVAIPVIGIRFESAAPSNGVLNGNANGVH